MQIYIICKVYASLWFNIDCLHLLLIEADMLSSIDRIRLCVYCILILCIFLFYIVYMCVSAEWPPSLTSTYDQHFCWQCHSVFCSWPPHIAPSLQPCSLLLGHLTPPFVFSASRTHHLCYYHGCLGGHGKRRYCELDCQHWCDAYIEQIWLLYKIFTSNCRIGFRRRTNIISNQNNLMNNNREYNNMEKYMIGRRSASKLSKPKGKWKMKWKSASFYIIMYFFTYNLKYESLPLGGNDLNFFI